MKCLYYPYFQLSPEKANLYYNLFSNLSIFCPLILRPKSFHNKIRFIDPLPKDLQHPFKNMVNEYRLFFQIYEDKSILEFLKHTHLVSEDEERPSSLISSLKGFKREKKEIPNILAACLFLWLVQEYRIITLSSWDILRGIEERERTLLEILGPDIEEIGITSEKIDYTHPDEDIGPFIKKILKAFAYLLEGREFSILVTDDKDIHRWIKNNTKDALTYQIYVPYAFSSDLGYIFDKIINTEFSNDYRFIIEETLLSWKYNEGEMIELLVLPQMSPCQHLLWLTGLKGESKKKKNGIYILG